MHYATIIMVNKELHNKIDNTLHNFWQFNLLEYHEHFSDALKRTKLTKNNGVYHGHC